MKISTKTCGFHCLKTSTYTLFLVCFEYFLLSLFCEAVPTRYFPLLLLQQHSKTFPSDEGFTATPEKPRSLILLGWMSKELVVVKAQQRWQPSAVIPELSHHLLCTEVALQFSFILALLISARRTQCLSSWCHDSRSLPFILISVSFCVIVWIMFQC